MILSEPETRSDAPFHSEESYYIEATESPAEERPRVLKQDDTFALYNRFGDIEQTGLGELGIYHKGTRFLSRMVLLLNQHRQLLLNSAIRDDNVLLDVES